MKQEGNLNLNTDLINEFKSFLSYKGPQVDDEKLIDEVKQHSFLYDSRSTDYRNLPLRATIWAQISKNLNIDDSKLKIKIPHEITCNSIKIFPFSKCCSKTMEGIA